MESRIAPASLVIQHNLPDIVVGPGKSGASIDLGNLLDADPTHGFHTFVTFHTNFDSDPSTPGIQGDITIELYDDLAPLTVQNFLSYATNLKVGSGYLGSFFERITSGFALQGGDFDTNFKAVATHAAVHNEFETEQLSNTLGTVSMAKFPDNPNSAQSGFFFNLADNSSTLDSSNGGFTVFGKLTDASLAVVQKISAMASVQDLTPGNNSPFTSVPTQHGYSTSTGLLPTAKQLIEITGVTVDPPTHGVTPPGVTYSVSVSNPGLVSNTLTGGTLNLKYQPGVTGISMVTVTAMDAMGNSVMDTFNVTVLPNLAAVSLGDPFSGVIVPGDAGKVPVKITNNGGAAAKGLVDVKIYLSEVTAGDPNGNMLDDIGGADVLIGSLLNVPLNLAANGSLTLSAMATVPTSLLLDSGKIYHVIAEVDPHTTGASPLSELFTDDNTIASTGGSALFNAFGTFTAGSASRVNAPLHYVDVNNHLVTINVKGGGFGQLVEDPTTHAITLALSNTTGKSIVTATVAGGGHTTLASITVNQPAAADATRMAMGTLSLGLIDVTGDITLAGGAKSITLGDLVPTDGNSHTLTIGDDTEGPGMKVSITLGNVTDFNLTSSEAITALSAQSWLDVNATAEKVSTTFLDSLSVKHDFEPDLTVLGGTKVQTVTIGGELKDSEIHIGGNVGNVTIGAMDGGDFFVGTTVKPTTSDDFDNFRSIASFQLKGLAGVTSAMSNSNVAASSISSLLIKSEDPASGTGTFGIEAEEILHYVRGTKVLNHLTTSGATAPDSDGHYAVTIV